MALQLFGKGHDRPRGADLADQLSNNAYITDGERLFRCVRGHHGVPLMLEDCRTLDLIVCSEEELVESELRLVKPGDDPHATKGSGSLAAGRAPGEARVHASGR